MRKIFFFALFLVAAVACNPMVDPYSVEFDINTDIASPMFDKAWVEVIPTTNDFYYSMDFVTVNYYSSFASDKDFIKHQLDSLHTYYERQGVDDLTFEEAMLYKGANIGIHFSLTPSTKYYVYAFSLDENGNPVEKLHLEPFTTKDYVPSDIEFEMSMTGSLLTVIPSNNDQYFYDYDLKETVDASYYYPSTFHRMTLFDYEEYGFMPGLADTGKSTSDFADFYYLEPGDRFYLTASGYRYGITSDIRIWLVTYKGPGVPADIVPFIEE